MEHNLVGQQSSLDVPVGAGRRDQRWGVPAVCLVLAVMTFAVFGQTLQHEFVAYDDDVYVYDNPMVSQGLTFKGIVWAFHSIHAYNWHPLTWISHMLDCQFYGLHPGGHHFTNVLLHTATAIALFLVLRQMTGAFWRSAFVAAVFAIHPLRVESVAWVAERKDVLSGLFFMLTLGAYVRFARLPWSWSSYALVLFLFAMGLMCKPMLVTLPLVLLLLDYWPLQRVQARKLSGLILEKVPLLALSAASCVATLLAQKGAIHSSGSFALSSRIGNVLATCMIYLRQMFWPAGLAVPYPYPKDGLPLWEVALAATLLAGLSAAAFWQRRKQPWLLTGWLWYLVMLLPVVGIIQVSKQAHADRYTYLPQIGIYVALTWLAAEWNAKLQLGRLVIGCLMTAVLAALMVCAGKQTAYWRDSETLWTHTLRCTTDNFVAHSNLGDALMEKDKLEAAVTQFKASLQIYPNYAEAHNNLGFALCKMGKTDEAISQYQTSLELAPAFALAHNNLGTALRQKGKMTDAIAQYQVALQLSPDYAAACVNMGDALLQMGRVDEAIPCFQRALQIAPAFALAHNNLGIALMQKGSVDDAIAEYQNALQTGPPNADTHYNLGVAFLQRGRVDEARALFQEALQIKPDYAEAHYNLGIVLSQKWELAEAIAQYQKALEIKPGDAEMLNSLGHAFLRQGRIEDAISQYQKALQSKPDDAKARNNLGDALNREGKLDEAITQFKKAVEIQPDFMEAHRNLAICLRQQGRMGEAIAHYQKALQIEPANPSTQNSLAWLLATCSEVSLRNGNKAVELARRADASTGGNNPVILRTLAAAFAEAGRFSEAAETAQRALTLPGAQSDAKLAGQLQSEMKLYQAGSSFHSPAQTH
jgi:protein O-mannosyl-transferase